MWEQNDLSILKSLIISILGHILVLLGESIGLGIESFQHMLKRESILAKYIRPPYLLFSEPVELIEILKIVVVYTYLKFFFTPYEFGFLFLEATYHSRSSLL